MGDAGELIPLLFVCDNMIEFLTPTPENYMYYDDRATKIFDQFINNIAEDLLLSEVNAALYKTPEGYEFYPATEEFLDNAMVSDILNWLNDYPKVKAQYDKALKMILQQAAPRDSIDNLRITFELFLREFFRNEKSLENPKSNLGEFMNGHNVSKQFSNMYNSLFTYYTLYNNDEVKHNNTVDKQEIDFLVYQTANFMRFLIQLKRNSMKVI